MIKLSNILLEKTGIKAPSKVLPEISYHMSDRKSSFSGDPTFHVGTIAQALDRAIGIFYMESKIPFPYYLHKVKIKEGLEIMDYVFDDDPEQAAVDNEDIKFKQEYDSNKIAYYLNAVEGVENPMHFSVAKNGMCKRAVTNWNKNFSIITDGKNVTVESVTTINSKEELKKLADSVCGVDDHGFDLEDETLPKDL